MAPTPTPRTLTTSGRGAMAPPTSTPAPPPPHGSGNMRTPQAKTLRPRATPTPTQALSTPQGDVERLADGLLADVTPLRGIAKENEDNAARQEAFESARKKFAMYGKQNAHVSHLSPDQRQMLAAYHRQRALKRQNANKHVQPSARRAVDWDESEGATVVLQNTLLLQENGELAAQLDDVEYHLDGVLNATRSRAIELDRGYAMAQSVVVLTGLLREEQVQAVIKVASQSQHLYAQIREVLLSLGEIEHRMFKMALAAMAYELTRTPDADEFFTHEVITAVVAALKMESKRFGDEREGVVTSSTGVSATQATENKTPLKKSFLKRKKSGSSLRRVSSGADDLGFDGNDGGVEQARARAIRDDQLRADLRKLLDGEEPFIVDGSIQLSIADLLCMVLHNILQIGGSQSESDSSSFGKTSTQRYFRRRRDLAGTTFEVIMSRKRLLVENQGLYLLIDVLNDRFVRLQDDLNVDLVQAPVSVDLASAFQRMRTMLRVLDQASFLATDVQLHMSKQPDVFRVTLKLIDSLSRLAWSHKSRRKWQTDPSFMQLVVDVLMAALRVIINLSHQNEDADTHIAHLDGTAVLFSAFCKLWGTVELAQGINRDELGHDMGSEDKIEYDALLLILSAITNCVEYSAENRSMLSKLDLTTSKLDGLEAFRASSVCSLLASFFLSKVQSYVHLIDMSETQHEVHGETWVPEDVILGGCTSLLLGCMMKDSSYNSAVILGALPDGSPRLLLRALSAFVALHSQIGALTPEVGKSVLEVEKLLKSFMFTDDQPTEESKRNTPTSSSRTIHSRGSPLESVQQVARSPPELTSSSISIRLKFTPGRKSREADVMEADGNGNDMDESQSSQLSHQVRSPPASAFKLRKFASVCSNVDDSDDLASDIDMAPAKPQSRLIPSVEERPQVKPKLLVSATVTLTPARRSTNEKNGQTESETKRKPSSSRRLKRTRQLVSDLEAEFMKIGSRVSSEINAAMTSTEDGDHLDFSQDLFLSQDTTAMKTPAKKAKTSGSLGTIRTTKAPDTKRTDVTPVTHKRKAKVTPPKLRKSDEATTSVDDSVFDFPG